MNIKLEYQFQIKQIYWEIFVFISPLFSFKYAMKNPLKVNMNE